MERLTVIGTIVIVLVSPFITRIVQNHHSLTLIAFVLFGIACGAIGVGVGKISCQDELRRLRGQSKIKTYTHLREND
jgi:tetrahydromethanopterin S-methyltransferase subunit E